MAHEISIREDGFAEMAYVGDAPWHGLGQELPEGQTIEQWRIAAGMDWNIQEADVEFSYEQDGETCYDSFPEKKILLRDDTREPLSVVGRGYKVVQPEEVLEFFRDLTYTNQMKLNTAGVLFGGRRFWALADVGESFTLGDEDEIKAHLLLVTSTDGTLATTAKFVATRVVCNNTLSWAMHSEEGRMVKVSHRSEFDPEAVKFDLDIYNDSWNEFTNNVAILSKTKVNAKERNKFFTNVATKGDNVSKLKIERLEDMYENAPGADMAKGTAWGLLNAVTYMYTHGTNQTQGDGSNKFWSGYNGVWYKEKQKAYKDITDRYIKVAA